MKAKMTINLRNEFNKNKRSSSEVTINDKIRKNESIMIPLTTSLNIDKKSLSEKNCERQIISRRMIIK